MDDIVTRLRSWPFGNEARPRDLMVTAADEIERLREGIKKIADTKDSVARSSIREYAATLLQPTK